MRILTSSKCAIPEAGVEAELVPEMMSDQYTAPPLTSAPFFFIERPNIGVYHAAQDRGLVPLQHDEVQPVGEGELRDPVYHLLESRPPGRALGLHSSGGGRESAARRHETCAEPGISEMKSA